MKLTIRAIVLLLIFASPVFAQDDGPGVSVEVDREVEVLTDTARDAMPADEGNAVTDMPSEKESAVEPDGDENGGAELRVLIGEYEGVVTKVLDADTIEINGERMRLLGVNAPEYQGSHNDCYGLEATKWLEAQIQDKLVTYSFDRSYSRRDEHGDTRIYVFNDGGFVNAELIANGMAFVDKSKSYAERDAMEAQQVIARRQNKGLWHTCPVECDRGGVCRTRNW
jgi:endonuclease YncB( thermonuclease family)